eukprot:COSAG01_NODE_9531_length_2417_cov_7.981717_4_plen_38_part_00
MDGTRYERDWANRMAWLDAAAVAGVHVLVILGRQIGD